jgi:hypothetical protein
MVVRFVCVFRVVPVCTPVRVSRECVPAPPVSILPEVGFEGVRFVRFVCLSRVSRLPPVSFYRFRCPGSPRCLFTGSGELRVSSVPQALFHASRGAHVLRPDVRNPDAAAAGAASAASAVSGASAISSASASRVLG